MTEKKIRYSRQREEIYNYMLSTKEHPSAEMVYEALKAEHPNLSLGTVYRNLNLLAELGKVRRVATVQNVDRFDAVCEDHAHFICECCGKVEDFFDVNMDSVKDLCGNLSDHRILRLNVVMEGRCSDCMKAALS